MDEALGSNLWALGLELILREFASYSFVFIPTFLIIAIESVWSLKTWQAVQKLPLTVNQSSARWNWDYRALADLAIAFYMVAMLILSLKRQMSNTSESFVVDYFLLTTLTPPLVYFVGRMIKMIMGLSKRVVFRRPTGHLALHILHIKKAENYSRLLRSLPYILAFIPVIISFFYESRVLVSIIIAAIGHFLVSSGTPRVVTGKYMIIAVAFNLAYLVALIVAWSAERRAFTLDAFAFPQHGRKIAWYQLFLTTFVVATPFSIIAACLRFDFSNSDSRVTLSDSLVENQSANLATTDDDVTKIAVEPPTRKGLNFPKPYFCAALIGWLASYLILACVVVLGKTEVAPAISGFYVSYLSPVVMVVTVGLVSLSRNETRKLWAYREDWYIKPRPSVDVETVVARSEEKADVENEKIEVLA